MDIWEYIKTDARKFHKPKIKFKKNHLIGSVIGIILLIIVIYTPTTENHEPVEKHIQTYSNGETTFHYPEGWILTTQSPGSIKLTKNSDWIVLNTGLNQQTYVKHKNTYIEERWRQEKNITIDNTQIELLKAPAELNTDTLVYLFQKNGKYYEVLTTNTYETRNIAENMIGDVLTT